MINLVFDGNYLFRKTFAIFRGFGKDQKLPQEVLKDDVGKGKFVRKVATDFAYALQSLPQGGKTIVVFDRRSWRKDFFEGIEEMGIIGYKASRKQVLEEGEIEEDWTPFFDIVTEYAAILEDKGFVVSYTNGAEGDDLIFKWVNKFKEMGQSSVIITGDQDLSQLVSGVGEPFVTCWDNNSKRLTLFAAQGWNFNWIGTEQKSSDLFNLDFGSQDAKASMKGLINRCELKEIKGEDVILEKILSGDAGDDVPSVWQIKNSKGTGWIRVTGKKTEKITEAFKQSYPGKLDEVWDPEALDHLAGLILRVIGDVDGTQERLEVVKNLSRNAKLVWLKDSMIPLDLSEEIDAHIGRKLETSRYPKGIKRQDILEGSNYAFTSNTTSSIPQGMNPLDLL